MTTPEEKGREEALIKTFDDMNVFDLRKIISMFEKKWDVSAAAPVTMMSAGPVESAAPTVFNLFMTGVSNPALKLPLIKFLREHRSDLGLSLTVAKEIVENLSRTPFLVAENLSKKDADAMKLLFETQGATVECRAA